MAFTPERENLYRGLPGGVDLRAADDAPTGDVMVGHFCRFDEWTEISSWYEGEFIERVAVGAAKKTIRENIAAVRVQYDHGYDTFVGSSPLGVIDVLREEDEGVWYEVPLLDTDYNRDRVAPQLRGLLMSGEERGSVLGASFRFRVVKDEWVMEPKATDHNPKALPERTITEFRLFEFGPVVFPAYQGATAGMRSLTDHYLERRREARSAQIPAAGLATASEPTNEPPAHSVDPRWLRIRAAAITRS